MTDKKNQPPKGGQKPFLGDEELSNELDAWDSMFDNLHGGPEAAAADEPVMEWPAPAPPSKPNRVPEAALTAPERTDEDLPVELEDQLTLDRAATNALAEETHIDVQAAPARASTFTKDTADADPLETDFSEIGAAGPPSALGDFLGATSSQRPSTQNGYEEAPEPIAVAVETIDEEDVYTSASRPRVQPAPDDYELAMDEPAPPPRPKPPSAPPRRTGPAIIRRATPVAVPLANYAPQPAPVQDDSPFAESTRVADLDEMASARAEARSKAPTAPPPFAMTETAPQPLIDEDDYADIEIGADSNEAEPEPTPPPPGEVSAPRRTAAHVVRRPEKATKQPVVPHKRESDPVIEVADSVPVEPAGEDDFSDVAAAVGVEDLGPGELIPRRRPETPPGGTDIVQIRPSAPHVASLDVALDSIGDIDDGAHETVTMSVDDVLSEEDADEPVAAPTRLYVLRARTPDSSADDEIDFGVEAGEPEELL